MATKEEKELLKAERKATQEISKAQVKEQKEVRKARDKSQKRRAKEETKFIKIARKQTGKEQNRRQAFAEIRKTQRQFEGMPPALWPMVALVVFIWARNYWEKESRERDLREAKRFLRESRGTRI